MSGQPLHLAFSSADALPFHPVLAIPLALVIVTGFSLLIRGDGRGDGTAVRTIFTGIALVFVSLILAAMAAGYYGAYARLRDAVLTHRYSQVEGCLEAFHPMPFSGHDEERIKVGGRVFSYSDFTLTPAFGTSESHGGPIHRDSYVRVGFVGGDIVRLEVADRACPPQMRDLPRTDP